MITILEQSTNVAADSTEKTSPEIRSEDALPPMDAVTSVPRPDQVDRPVPVIVGSTPCVPAMPAPEASASLQALSQQAVDGVFAPNALGMSERKAAFEAAYVAGGTPGLIAKEKKAREYKIKRLTNDALALKGAEFQRPSP
jgi:hypothetical protein